MFTGKHTVRGGVGARAMLFLFVMLNFQSQFFQETIVDLHFLNAYGYMMHMSVCW